MRTLVTIFLIVIAVLSVTYFLRDKYSPSEIVENEFIKVTSPQVYDEVSSPIEIVGQARGNWYFEASFPIKLLDAQGKEIAQGIATADGDWMTTEFVPFKASLSFSNPETSTGTLVLSKDNPSGLAENDDKIEVPVKFNQTPNKETRTISLFYYNPEKDKDETGNILCTDKGLEKIEREIPVTITPIQDAVRLLLKGNLSQEEVSRGVTTEFPLSGFELNSASVSNNILTLNFSDPNHKTVGGSCRVGVLWSQIKATAGQFGEFSDIKFTPEDLFQP